MEQGYLSDIIKLIEEAKKRVEVKVKYDTLFNLKYHELELSKIEIDKFVFRFTELSGDSKPINDHFVDIGLYDVVCSFEEFLFKIECTEKQKDLKKIDHYKNLIIDKLSQIDKLNNEIMEIKKNIKKIEKKVEV